MRIGQNPSRKNIEAYQPQKIGLASLVYIPHLNGYFSNALEILDVHIKSLLASTEIPFDYLVFDNGSCKEVRQYLYGLAEKGRIRWLVASDLNLGKTGALNWIFSAMPNSIIGYSDSDVLFRKGWLEKSLQILDGFAETGIVSGQPAFFNMFENGSNAWDIHQSTYPVEKMMPQEEVVDEYCTGITASDELRRTYQSTPLAVISSTHNNQKAVLGATHMQFLAKKDMLLETLPLPSRLGLSPTEDLVFNLRIDQLGYLQLSVMEPLVFHMGNHLEETIISELAEINLDNIKPTASRTSQNFSKYQVLRKILNKINQNRLGKRYINGLYNMLFEIISQK